MRVMNKTVNVVVGTPIYRRGAFVLDKFLANQKEIQQNYPSSALVLATEEDDFIEELERLLSSWDLKGKVISFTVAKPDYARNKAWNLACGRETIRQYVLSQTEAGYLLFLDADMTFDPNVIEIMEREIQGYDVVYSGYRLHKYGAYDVGTGCSMFTRGVLEKLRFRCLEFKNGELIGEGHMCELNLIELGSRTKKGFFLSIVHYKSEKEAASVTPRPLGLLRTITNSSAVRYPLIKASIIVRHDITMRLQYLVYGFLAAIRSMASWAKEIRRKVFPLHLLS